MAFTESIVAVRTSMTPPPGSALLTVQLVIPSGRVRVTGLAPE